MVEMFDGAFMFGQLLREHAQAIDGAQQAGFDVERGLEALLCFL